MAYGGSSFFPSSAIFSRVVVPVGEAIGVSVSEETDSSESSSDETNHLSSSVGTFSFDGAHNGKSPSGSLVVCWAASTTVLDSHF